MCLISTWLKVTAGFWTVLSAMYVMSVGCVRTLFGGDSVQQSVPVVDPLGDRGQCLSVVGHWCLPFCILFSSILFCSILFYSILFYSILFFSVLFCSVCVSISFV
jgi:hypothetical protein